MTCPLLTFGSDGRKQHWLPRLQQGTAVRCLGLTEPNSARTPPVCALPPCDGSGFVLNGEKTWITNRTPADVALFVWARLDAVIRVCADRHQAILAQESWDLRSVYLSLLDQGIRFDPKLLEQSLARLGLAKLKP